MRRVMLVSLALIIGLIGAGIFVVTTNALAQSAPGDATIPATNATALTTGKPAMPEPAQAIPAASEPYGANAEAEITTPAPKMQGHACESGY